MNNNHYSLRLSRNRQFVASATKPSSSHATSLTVRTVARGVPASFRPDLCIAVG